MKRARPIAVEKDSPESSQASFENGKSGLFSHLNIKQLILDSKVVCLFCGTKLLLSELVAHQKHSHFTPNEELKPKIKSAVCMFCNNRMPSSSLVKHQKRKHPAEYEKMSKKKALQKTDNLVRSNQPAMNKNPVINKLSAIATATASVQTIELDSEVKQPTLGQTKAVLSFEQDDDGFFELVITEI